MTEIATIDWFGRWGTSVFSENTAIFYYSLVIVSLHFRFSTPYYTAETAPQEDLSLPGEV